MNFASLALIGMLSLDFYFQSENKIKEYGAGIQFILTHPYVLDRYGVETNSSKTPCSKSTVFLVNDSSSTAVASILEQEIICVKGEKIEDIFFHAYDAYFKLVDFKLKKNEYLIKLELITPKYEPIGKNQLFLELHYKYSDQKIEVIQFEELVKENSVKIKSGKEIKKDLLLD